MTEKRGNPRRKKLGREVSGSRHVRAGQKRAGRRQRMHAGGSGGVGVWQVHAPDFWQRRVLTARSVVKCRKDGNSEGFTGTQG